MDYLPGLDISARWTRRTSALSTCDGAVVSEGKSASTAEAIAGLEDYPGSAGLPSDRLRDWTHSADPVP